MMSDFIFIIVLLFCIALASGLIQVTDTNNNDAATEKVSFERYDKDDVDILVRYDLQANEFMVDINLFNHYDDVQINVVDEEENLLCQGTMQPRYYQRMSCGFPPPTSLKDGGNYLDINISKVLDGSEVYRERHYYFHLVNAMAITGQNVVTIRQVLQQYIAVVIEQPYPTLISSLALLILIPFSFSYLSRNPDDALIHSVESSTNMFPPPDHPPSPRPSILFSKWSLSSSTPKSLAFLPSPQSSQQGIVLKQQQQSSRKFHLVEFMLRLFGSLSHRSLGTTQPLLQVSSPIATSTLPPTASQSSPSSLSSSEQQSPHLRPFSPSSSTAPSPTSATITPTTTSSSHSNLNPNSHISTPQTEYTTSTSTTSRPFEDGLTIVDQQQDADDASQNVKNPEKKKKKKNMVTMLPLSLLSPMRSMSQSFQSTAASVQESSPTESGASPASSTTADAVTSSSSSVIRKSMHDMIQEAVYGAKRTSSSSISSTADNDHSSVPTNRSKSSNNNSNIGKESKNESNGHNNNARKDKKKKSKFGSTGRLSTVKPLPTSSSQDVDAVSTTPTSATTTTVTTAIPPHNTKHSINNQDNPNRRSSFVAMWLRPVVAVAACCLVLCLRPPIPGQSNLFDLIRSPQSLFSSSFSSSSSSVSSMMSSWAVAKTRAVCQKLGAAVDGVGSWSRSQWQQICVAQQPLLIPQLSAVNIPTTTTSAQQQSSSSTSSRTASSYVVIEKDGERQTSSSKSNVFQKSLPAMSSSSATSLSQHQNRQQHQRPQLWFRKKSIVPQKSIFSSANAAITVTPTLPSHLAVGRHALSLSSSDTRVVEEIDKRVQQRKQ